jgi:outer membrane protein
MRASLPGADLLEPPTAMKKFRLLVPLLLATLATPAWAQSPGSAPDALAEHDALRLALADNPTLRAALIDIRRAQANVEAEEDRYPLTLQLDAGANHIRSPSLARDQAGNPTTQISTTDSMVLGSQLQQDLPWGTSLAFRLEGTWGKRAFPLFPSSPVTLTVGPGYGLNARFSVVQPLLRGFGDEVGDANRRAAALDETVTVKASDRAASELLRDVLSAYWELWYGREAEAIEQQARELADKERQDAQARIDEGVDAPASIHSFSTQVAESDEAVLTARFERQQRAVSLGLLLGRPGAEARAMTATPDEPPELDSLPPVERLIDQAAAASPELRELDAQIDQAHDRERVAGESDRQRLDVEGWVQTQGLGNQRVSPAFEQFGGFEVFSAHVGLVYELPLTGSRVASQQAAARHAADVLEARREALMQRVESDVRTMHQRAQVAARRVALARRTTKFAEARLQAAQDNFDLGRGLSVEIERAEDTLRRARLRTARAQVDVAQARFGLEHLTGRLLAQHAAAVEGLRAGDAQGRTPVAPRGPY